MDENKHIEVDIDEYLNTYFDGEQEKQIRTFLKKMALHYYEKGKEIGKKEIIDNAGEWLNNFYSEDRHCYLVKEDIDAFIKAIEE